MDSFRKRPALAVWLALCLAAGCEDDNPASPSRLTPPPEWTQVTDLPALDTYYALWAPGSDTVLAVGPLGRVHRWDGLRWEPVANEALRDLYAIAGTPGGPVVAVGKSGTVAYYIDNRFVLVNTPTVENLQGVWMVSPGDLFAVGDAGTVLRGDGLAWSIEATPTHAALYGVWGAGAGDVFAVGIDGTILRRDAVEWRSIASGTTEILAAVSGTSASDVYAVGSAGTILHFDGSAWSPMASGTGELLQSVWAPGGPIAVGANGTILRFHQGAWTRDAGVTTAWLYGVARSGSRAWAVGAHAIFAHDGSAWTAPTRGAVPALRGVGRGTSTTVTLCGEDGYIARGRAGSWRVEDTGAARRLNAVWQSEAGVSFAVGTNRILRREGTAWVEEHMEVIEFTDIGGTDSRIFAVGALARIRERTGSGWRPSPIGGTVRVTDDLHAIAMASGNLGYIAGANGVVLRFDGTTWTPMATRTSADLYDIAATGDGARRAIAVGDGGVVRVLTPEVGWTRMDSPTTVPLYALARGPRGEWYAAGALGTVIRLVNDTWVSVISPTSGTLRAAWSRGEALFLSGGDAPDGGILLRYGPPLP